MINLSKLPLVSIVIVNWNRKKDLEECLNSVYSQSYDNLEVVIVDNHSTDGSVDMVREKFPLSKLIIMPDSSYGACETFNIGFSSAGGEYIVVMDNDAETVDKDVIKNIVELFQNDQNLGIISCNVINFYTGKSECQPVEKLGIEPQYSVNNLVYYPYYDFHGAGAGLNTKMLNDVGYYDKSLFIYGNEKDLSARALIKGYELNFYPTIKFYHKLKNQSRPSARSIYYLTKNFSNWANTYLPFGKRLNFVLGVVSAYLKVYIIKKPNQQSVISSNYKRFDMFKYWAKASIISLIRCFWYNKRNIMNKNLIEYYNTMFNEYMLSNLLKKKLKF